MATEALYFVTYRSTYVAVIEIESAKTKNVKKKKIIIKMFLINFITWINYIVLYSSYLYIISNTKIVLKYLIITIR